MRKLTTFAMLATFAALGAGCMRPAQPVVPSADVSADVKKIQGMWAIETFDNGALDKRTDAEKARDLKDIQQVRFRFDGNKLYIVDGGREEFFATFALDETKNPKVLHLTRGFANDAPRGTYRGTAPYTTSRGSAPYPSTSRASTAPYPGTVRSTYRGTSRSDDGPASRELDKWSWIYKFDGDVLTVAFCRDDKKVVPTEFKARAETPTLPGVVVISFKRTTELPPGPSGTNRTTTARGTYRGTSK